MAAPKEQTRAAKDAVDDLHARVEEQAGQLHVLHAERLQCRRGCAQCCVDGLTVFEVEAENIRLHHPDLLKDGVPHPEGACAFLDGDGACRVYAQRPYVCRTQGLPLRWIDELADGTPAEFRDICPLNEEGEPVEELPSDSCWTLGPAEGALADLQHREDGGQGRRVALRDLFARRD